MEITQEESDKEIIRRAVFDLFVEYNKNYSSIKKYKRKGNLVIEVRTGGWSENEEAIAKFTKTKLSFADIEWWFFYEWRRGGYFKWQIPLFLVEE